MNLFYILLLIILPISAYILIHKIILEKYYELQFMRQNNILFYDFFKLFFAGYTPFIIFRYLCLVLGIKTKAGYINLLIILYSAYISGKILCEYLLTLSILNKENIKYLIHRCHLRQFFFAFVNDIHFKIFLLIKKCSI